VDQTERESETEIQKSVSLRVSQRRTMPAYYCYGCGVHIFLPSESDIQEDEEDYYNYECCDTPSWVDYEVKKRARKNLKLFKYKMWTFSVLLKEYKLAKERVKYAPGGTGFFEAFEEFETLKNGKKRSKVEESQSSKVQKVCF